jgi:hypothetical protein
MKKLVLSALFFCALVPVTFAQTQAEKLFQANVEDYKKNPMKNIQDRASDDFVLISGNGYIADKAKTAAIFKNVSHVDVSFNNLKIRQIGNTLIATGQEHSVRHHTDGTPDLVTDYLSTYVYQINGSQLISLSVQHTIPAARK